MTTHGVIYEEAADGSWSARAAELPVYAVGDTREEAEREVGEAIALYLAAERLLDAPDAPVPDPQAMREELDALRARHV
ncbi:MAG: type II toxin-antitoxin system HicB family antitoxin [Solirubrobacterales bacterium]